MKRILVSLLTPVLVIGVVGSGALAWFSDTETSTDNDFTVGTLDLGLANSEPGQELPTGSVTATFTTENWAPGQTKDGTLYISNAGSIDMTIIKLEFDSAVTGSRPTSVDAGPGGTTDDLEKMVSVTAATWKGTSVTSLVGQTIADLTDGSSDEIILSDFGTPGGLDGEETGALYLKFTFNGNATNECQGKTMDLTLAVTGIQDEG